jgi:hypothetical protein
MTPVHGMAGLQTLDSMLSDQLDADVFAQLSRFSTQESTVN